MSENVFCIDILILLLILVIDDDLDQLEKEKVRKIVLSNVIKIFNYKFKNGIKFLFRDGFILSDKFEDIVQFLLCEDRLDKV